MHSPLRTSTGSYDLDEADDEHRHPCRPDEVSITSGYSLVDDLHIEAGQIQRSDGCRDLPDDDHYDEQPISLQVCHGQVQ